MPDAIKYLDARGLLRLGGGMSSTQIAALDAGKTRALKQLSEAASLTVSGNTARVVNLAGHRLISGYPEGRRMWLNVKWYDGTGTILREDGRYGTLNVSIDGSPAQVSTLLDLGGANTRVYEAHYGLTQEWASQLLSLGYPAALPVSFDRVTGAVTYTLGDVATQAPGTSHESFHFVLSNTVEKDNRIPPYGMRYDEARRRNALPVPATQYGSPGPGGAYQHWDDIAINPPAGAVYADLDLLYQPTSWEYVQFLHLANKRQDPFLADEGANLLDAWRNTGMAAPYSMGKATWGTPPAPPAIDLLSSSMSTWSLNKSGALATQTNTFLKGATVGIKLHAVDPSGVALSGVQVFMEIRSLTGTVITSLQGFTDISGDAVFKWKTSRTQAAGGYTANVVDMAKSGYLFNAGGSVTSVAFILQ